MKIEISFKDMMEIYEFASQGKLIEGLVHNLNGQLQNINMEVEMMMHHSVKAARKSQDNLSNKFNSGLKKVDELITYINNDIKTFIINAGVYDESSGYISLNEFIRSELQSLKVNLYFKHNVHQELQLKETSPLIRNLPKRFCQAFRWFLQAFAEELERTKIQQIRVKTYDGPSGINIILSSEKISLSKKFLKLLKTDIPSSRPLTTDKNTVGILLSLAIFKSEGGAVTCSDESSGSNITFVIPVPYS